MFHKAVSGLGMQQHVTGHATDIRQEMQPSRLLDYYLRPCGLLQLSLLQLPRVSDACRLGLLSVAVLLQQSWQLPALFAQPSAAADAALGTHG